MLKCWSFFNDVAARSKKESFQKAKELHRKPQHPSCHPKIMVAAVREYAYEDILHAEQDLYKASLTEDDMTIVKRMKAIVP